RRTSGGGFATAGDATRPGGLFSRAATVGRDCARAVDRSLPSLCRGRSRGNGSARRDERPRSPRLRGFLGRGASLLGHPDLRTVRTGPAGDAVAGPAVVRSPPRGV